MLKLHFSLITFPELHNNTGLKEKEKKKKFAICSFISSCPLGTSGLPTEAVNILTTKQSIDSWTESPQAKQLTGREHSPIHQQNLN